MDGQYKFLGKPPKFRHTEQFSGGLVRYFMVFSTNGLFFYDTGRSFSFPCPADLSVNLHKPFRFPEAAPLSRRKPTPKGGKKPRPPSQHAKGKRGFWFCKAGRIFVEGTPPRRILPGFLILRTDGKCPLRPDRSARRSAPAAQGTRR